MFQLKIGTQITVLGLLALLGMILIGLIGYFSNIRLVDSIESVGATSTVLRNQTEADMMHDGIRADVLDMFRLSTQANPSAEEIKEVRTGLTEHLENFNRLVAENDKMDLPANERAALDALKPDLAEYVRMAKVTADQFEQHTGDANAAYQAFYASFKKLEESLEKFSSLIETNIHAETDQQKSLIKNVQLFILLSVLAGGAILAVAVFLVTRGITQPIKAVSVFLAQLNGDLRKRLPDFGRNELGEMGRSVNELIHNQATTVSLIQRASTEVDRVAIQLKNRSTTTCELTDQVNQEARHIGEITDQLASSVEEVLYSVDLTTQRAATATKTATEAHASMARSHEVTGNLISVTRQTSTMIEELGSAATEISSIAAVIKDIAEQTNLLALNAAIEAARAGEFGRGFAVVADEVRKLAERTAASTADIAKMTQHIGHATGSATRAMQDVSDGVNRGAIEVRSAMTGQDAIVRDTEEMMSLSAGIAQAAQKETIAIKDTAMVMSEISHKISAAADAVKDMNSDTDRLSGVVADLQKNVAQFHV